MRRLGLHPDLWAGLSPNGVGRQKPHHYRDMFRIAREHSGHPQLAWNLLTRGVCDGCALGVAGLHDWTIDGVHLCTTRLELLSLNTAGPLDPSQLSDVGPLDSASGADLRALGRLAHPMRRRRRERGFQRIGWDEALDVLAAALSAATPDRAALYLTSRGLTNETYYVAAKAARAIGTANIDSAARVCHAPSTLGLKATIGVAASTCSLRDVIESDLIVLWGTNPANNQPVFMKYLDQAKRRGAQVVVVNPYLEPGLDRYWVPSSVESAIFGTRVCDLHVPVRPGGDVAFANAVLCHLDATGRVDREFVEAHTEGWDETISELRAVSLDEQLGAAGVSRAVLEEFCDRYAGAAASVLVWSMGITQHTTGVEGVRGIVNVALAQGNVGRNGAGLMPIRGHSGVQGGAEMGAYATALPGGLDVTPANAAALAAEWGFAVPDAPGLTAPEMLDAASDGRLDVLWSSGGNFLEVLPDPDAVRTALERVPLRVHQDVVVSSQMLVPGDDVLLLPVATRYEQEGGGTSTTTERRVAFSPEITSPPGEARSEWRLFAEVAARVRPEVAGAFDWVDNRALRAEIARVVPTYAGIEHLERTGDAVQWGGRHLCSGGRFPTPSGRARFSPLTPVDAAPPEGRFLVGTRRGKQFNSMVHAQVDPLTGAVRDAVYVDRDDAASLGLTDGDPVLLRSEVGEFRGVAHLCRLPRGSLQVHWPEGNVLLPAGAEDREPESRIPSYQAVVEVIPLRGSGADRPDP
ncbi:MAG: FdhF/YdeP family oxidoreductase [Actinobacteria bacterium]|nr:FdhF/YdeP family oxidoreductase [Actinomycetota bacterium]